LKVKLCENSLVSSLFIYVCVVCDACDGQQRSLYV